MFSKTIAYSTLTIFKPLDGFNNILGLFFNSNKENPIG
jgi:hypothetical protein